MFQSLYIYADTYLLPIHNKCTEIEWYVFDTEHSTELIQTKKEPLRSKLVFTEQLIFRVAIFINLFIYLDSKYKSTFLVQLQ